MFTREFDVGNDRSNNKKNVCKTLNQEKKTLFAYTPAFYVESLWWERKSFFRKRRYKLRLKKLLFLKLNVPCNNRFFYIRSLFSAMVAKLFFWVRLHTLNVELMKGKKVFKENSSPQKPMVSHINKIYFNSVEDFYYFFFSLALTRFRCIVSALQRTFFCARSIR